MALTLSDADYKTILGELFLFKNPMPVLPKPANTDDDSVATNLAKRMKPIAADARFTDLSIGVVDFTADRMAPRVWLHREDAPWRIGSTGKIAVLLAAVQLRDDVRKVKATGLVTAASDLDDLFDTIWMKSTNGSLREIAGKKSSPRVSTIFDVAKPIPDFFGADVQVDPSKLNSLPRDKWGDVYWRDLPDLTFWERLWLMGAHSDNTAASSCISEIGIAYMKAVQLGYGLFDPAHGMHLLLAGQYKGIVTKTRVSRNAGAPEYRERRNQKSTLVTDVFIDKKTRKPSHLSEQPGSAAALTAYMVALMQDKFVDKEACDTIRTHLADHTPDTVGSLIFDGVNAIPGTTISLAHTKLGILGVLRCEFAYLEASARKYAVVALGLLPKRVGAKRFSEVDQGNDLGVQIHQALL